MLLSVPELITWTGLGPFEVSLHCFALSVVSILSTLRLTDILSASWHVVFVPLYVAVALTVHFNVVLFIRMSWYVKRKSWRKKEKRLTVTMIIFNTIGIVLLLLLEYSTAEYLERRLTDSNSDYNSGLITMVTLFLAYFLARLFLVHRSLARLYS